MVLTINKRLSMEELELEMVFKEENEETTSEWGKLTPIVETNGVVSVYLNGLVDVPEAYNELYHTLVHTEADEIRIMLNNGGGNMDTALSIIQSMGQCNAMITGVLSGTVASAATMITLQCDKLEIAPYTTFMVHYYSSGSQGKGNELEAKYKFDKVQIPKIFKALYKDFLTSAEITKVIKGYDMWMDSEEVQKRFDKMKGK